MPFCTNCGSENPRTNKYCTNCGSVVFPANKDIESNSPQSQTHLVQPDNSFVQEEGKRIRLLSTSPPPGNPDIRIWVFKHRKIFFGITGFAILVWGIYYFFLKNDPAKDAKRAAVAYCNCIGKFNEAQIRINEEFLNSFDNYGFKSRQEARNKLLESQNQIIYFDDRCNSEADLKHTDLRNRYSSSLKTIVEFDDKFKSQRELCIPSNQSKLTSIYSDVEQKIVSIKDPVPDIEKIKTDLIGQKIPGWKFDYLAEIQSAKILNTSRGSDRIEFHLDLHLVSTTYPTTDVHDSQIVSVYLLNDQGWYLNNVQLLYITYINNAPVNEWKTIIPLQNCSYSILDQGHAYWVQDGYWGTKYMGGPNGDTAISLKSKEIYLMSRENIPVDLIFKYVPNR